MKKIIFALIILTSCGLVLDPKLKRDLSHENSKTNSSVTRVSNPLLKWSMGYGLTTSGSNVTLQDSVRLNLNTKIKADSCGASYLVLLDQNSLIGVTGANLTGYYKSDHIHPVLSGDQIMANEVNSVLQIIP